MKVKELIKKLQECNPEHEVVIEIEEDNVVVYSIVEIDLGWTPSNVVALKADEFIMG